MTKKTKAIRTIAAVTAAALLGGGIYLLVKNDFHAGKWEPTYREK